METCNISINDKSYQVKVFRTEEEKEKGLQDITFLPKNEGAIFIYDAPETVQFWMFKTLIPLDIIFINEDWEVMDIVQGEPNSEDLLECDDVKYVLELGENSGIQENDEVDLTEVEGEEEIEEEEEEKEERSPMVVVGPRGKTQVELKGGERIYSRKNTKTLVRLAKRGYKSKKESDYKSLGRKMFEYIKTQDSNDPQYVEIKDKK